MSKHVVEFYKTLFGIEDRVNIKMEENFWNADELVTPEENEMLEASFIKAEIKQAIDSAYADGALGPDGFSFMVHQKFSEAIKHDIMAMVKGFEKGEINISRINYAMIILIPKEEDARSLKKFMPISLINGSFKIFAKALNNRLVIISHRLLASNQTAFCEW
jgi:hypothetical protein